MNWRGSNFGAGLKAVAEAIEADRPAFIHGDRIVSWGEFDRLTDNIAANLLARGLKPGDVAGQHLRNCPEYMISWFACAKAGVISVNINYHYKPAELRDIFERFGINALFTQKEFSPLAKEAADTMEATPLLIECDGEDWTSFTETSAGPEFRHCDDPEALMYVATGGTTGMPKAVMWPHVDAWDAFKISTWQRGLLEMPWVAETLDEHAQRASKHRTPSLTVRSPQLVLCPLMHGTGLFGAIIQLLHGGTLITMPTAKFDPDQTIDTIRDQRPQQLVIVGDAFAKPLIERLEGREDAAEAISSLTYIGSSGTIFSLDIKERLIALNPGLIIADALGSSESAGTAVCITTAAGTTGGGTFAAVPGRETKVFDENLQELHAGDEKFGILARSGPLPLGYLGEDEKNAKTFPVIDGVRYLLTGDFARFRADGSIEFKGRDNMCINSGGEKIFPEEVEATLMAHPEVADVRVVGVPDDRFGNKVTAVVRAERSGTDLESQLDDFARQNIATYKVPRLYVFTDQSLRLNNGKPDYRTAQALADSAA